jgi:hypothetical protein
MDGLTVGLLIGGFTFAVLVWAIFEYRSRRADQIAKQRAKQGTEHQIAHDPPNATDGRMANYDEFVAANGANAST